MALDMNALKGDGEVSKVEMQRYIVTLKHDGGYIRLGTVTSTPEDAVDQILRAEHAPQRSVVSVRVAKFQFWNYETPDDDMEED